jgi:O-methyltransferase involved in polyketide biosynthesis
MAKASVRSRLELSGAPETLLIPLWARARETVRPDGLIRDPFAARIIESIDFDFSTFERHHVAGVDFCLRARLMDDLIQDTLEKEAEGRSVVEFGPGLDTRFHRLCEHAGRWVEIDFPEVTSLRERFFGCDPRRKTIARSILDWNWVAEAGELGSRPVFIAEGVLYFLSREEVRGLFSGLADRFPGGSFLFDAQGPLFLKLSNWLHPLRGSRLNFYLNGMGEEISTWDSRLRIERCVGFGESPYYDALLPRLTWWKRAAARLGKCTRPMFKVVQVRFGDKERPFPSSAI